MRIGVVGFLLLMTHILEITLLQHIRIGGVLPNLMVVIVISFSLLRGQKEGAIIGVVAGLLYDISFGFLIGGRSMTYGLIGYFCGKLNKNFYRENFILPFMCTVASGLFISVVPLLRFIMLGKINLLFFLRTIIIPELIYTITVSLVIYQLTYIINERIETREKRTRNIF